MREPGCRSLQLAASAAEIRKKRGLGKGETRKYSPSGSCKCLPKFCNLGNSSCPSPDPELRKDPRLGSMTPEFKSQLCHLPDNLPRTLVSPLPKMGVCFSTLKG